MSGVTNKMLKNIDVDVKCGRRCCASIFYKLVFNFIIAFQALQERLERQHHENEQERARLQGLLSKMEAQLTEQTRSMEEVSYNLLIVFDSMRVTPKPMPFFLTIVNSKIETIYDLM